MFCGKLGCGPSSKAGTISAIASGVGVMWLLFASRFTPHPFLRIFGAVFVLFTACLALYHFFGLVAKPRSSGFDVSGSPTMDSSFCPRCGRRVATSDGFCAGCGCPLSV